MKKGMMKFLAGMCAVLILPTGSAQTILAEEPEQNLPVSVEKAVNQALKLWYNSPAKINTAESSSGEWMQQSLPLGNGNLGNLIFGGISKERIHFNEKTLWTGGPSPKRPQYQFIHFKHMFPPNGVINLAKREYSQHILGCRPSRISHVSPMLPRLPLPS